MFEEIPYEINSTFAAGWWKPFVKDGDDIYVAFTTPAQGLIDGVTSHHVIVGKRDSSGSWTFSDPLVSKGVAAKFRDDEGHNQTTITVDGSGRIHVISSMHNSWWDAEGQPTSNELGYGHYWRSSTAGDITTMADCSIELPNPSNETNNYRYTYPILCKDSVGDVYLIVRRRDSTDNAPMIMYRWVNSTNTWGIIGRVADRPSGATYIVNVYPDDLVCTADGNVHLAFSWKKGGASGRRHMPSYIRYKPSNGNFYNATPALKSIPVDWNDGLEYQPLYGSETLDGGSTGLGQQIGKLALTPTYAVHAVYRFKSTSTGPDFVKRARFSSGWIRDIVYTPTDNTKAGVDVTNDGTTVRAYYIKTDDDLAYVAEKTTENGWVESALNDFAVERLSVDEDDIVFLSRATTGEHWIKV